MATLLVANDGTLVEGGISLAIDASQRPGGDDYWIPYLDVALFV